MKISLPALALMLLSVTFLLAAPGDHGDHSGAGAAAHVQAQVQTPALGGVAPKLQVTAPVTAPIQTHVAPTVVPQVQTHVAPQLQAAPVVPQVHSNSKLDININNRGPNVGPNIARDTFRGPGGNDPWRYRSYNGYRWYWGPSGWMVYNQGLWVAPSTIGLLTVPQAIVTTPYQITAPATQAITVPEAVTALNGPYYEDGQGFYLQLQDGTKQYDMAIKRVQ